MNDEKEIPSAAELAAQNAAQGNAQDNLSNEAPGQTEGAAPAAAPKRRGRPPKNPDAAAAQKPAGAKVPPKSKAKVASDADPAKLGNQLVGLHTVAAMATGIPEIAISEKEGQGLATAIIAVCEEYDLSLSGKTGAALQLLGTAAMIYAPRVFAVNSRMQSARANQAAHDEARTVDAPVVVM